MRRRIYVASSWRNPHQPGVVAALREADFEVYDFRNPAPGDPGFHWLAIDPAWQAWSTELYLHHLETHEIALDGFMKDKAALDWAYANVLVMPCGRSAHLELGYSIGQLKPTVIFYPPGETVEPELMSLLAAKRCTSLDQVIAYLEAAI